MNVGTNDVLEGFTQPRDELTKTIVALSKGSRASSRLPLPRIACSTEQASVSRRQGLQDLVTYLRIVPRTDC
jgi:hypothetical protein